MSLGKGDANLDYHVDADESSECHTVTQLLWFLKLVQQTEVWINFYWP